MFNTSILATHIPFDCNILYLRILVSEGFRDGANTSGGSSIIIRHKIMAALAEKVVEVVQGHESQIRVYIVDLGQDLRDVLRGRIAEIVSSCHADDFLSWCEEAECFFPKENASR